MLSPMGSDPIPEIASEMNNLWLILNDKLSFLRNLLITNIIIINDNFI